MKNIKTKEITKKGLALVLALVMELAGAALETKGASAETYTYGGNTLVQQEAIANPMTIEEFALECNKDAEYLGGIASENAKKARPYGGFIPYDHLMTDNQNLEFLTNIAIIPKEVREELISNGIISEGMLAFASAYNLINLIARYNQDAMKEGHSRKPIHAWELCYDEHDKALLETVHGIYYNAYVTALEGKKGTLFDNPDFNMLLGYILNTNYGVENGNLRGGSVGARWLGDNIYGLGLWQLKYDYIQKFYTTKEIGRVFDLDAWNKGQLVVKKGIDLRYEDCINDELKLIAFYLGQLEEVIFANVNNDMFVVVNSFETQCK